jgi:ATP-dependent DNA ligase
MNLAISKIEKLDMHQDRYDIQVEDNENFFANGILVHNCRTIAIVKKESVEYYSRSGKIAYELEGLFDEELYNIRAHLNIDFVLDCERISDLGFEATVNAKKSGNDAAKASLRLRAFFLMPLTDWMKQKCPITMEQNRLFLKKLLPEVGVKKIILTEGHIVKDEKEMMEFCNEAIDLPENKARKIEGLILKELSAPYTWDRSYSWIKVKRFYPADARIIGFYYGRPKSRLENTIGGAVMAGWTEDKVYFETCCGSGFTDELRADILANMKSYIGKTAVLKFQEVSTTKSKKHASLRFPTLDRSAPGGICGGIRDDKIVEMHDDAVLDFKGRKMFEVK